MTGDLMDTAADAFQAVSGFLAGSKYSRMLQDMQDARAEVLDARDRIRAESGTKAEFQAVLALAEAQLTYIDASISVLNTQITAVDMMAGGSAAHVVSKWFANGSNTYGNGGGMGQGNNALILGGAGLGLGLLLSSNRNDANNATSRRR